MQYGIRTVVMLRQAESIARDPVAQEELAISRQKGIAVVNIPFEHSSADQQIAQFLEIMRKRENHPVLIHCSKGEERSGLFVLAYRMAVQVWSHDRAMAEMVDYGFERDHAPKIWALAEAYTSPESSVAVGKGRTAQ